MERITIHLDIPEIPQDKRELLRENIASAITQTFKRSGFNWLYSVGQPPTDEMARALIDIKIKGE
jgi:hypothetical protein